MTQREKEYCCDVICKYAWSSVDPETMHALCNKCLIGMSAKERKKAYHAAYYRKVIKPKRKKVTRNDDQSKQ